MVSHLTINKKNNDLSSKSHIVYDIRIVIDSSEENGHGKTGFKRLVSRERLEKIVKDFCE